MHVLHTKFFGKFMYNTIVSSFTYTVFITSIFQYVFAKGTMPAVFIWQLAGVSVATAVLQSLFFTTAIIKRLAMPLRVTGFLVCLLGILSLFAWLGGWFPLHILKNWAIFVGSFAIVGTAITTAIAAYYYKKGKEYTEQLRHYQANQ